MSGAPVRFRLHWQQAEGLAWLAEVRGLAHLVAHFRAAATSRPDNRSQVMVELPDTTAGEQALTLAESMGLPYVVPRMRGAITRAARASGGVPTT